MLIFTGIVTGIDKNMPDCKKIYCIAPHRSREWWCMLLHVIKEHKFSMIYMSNREDVLISTEQTNCSETELYKPQKGEKRCSSAVDVTYSKGRECQNQFHTGGTLGSSREGGEGGEIRGKPGFEAQEKVSPRFWHDLSRAVKNA
jgi:hypothetical protein